jgi:hypothetical protein
MEREAMHIVKSVGVLSVAKIIGLIYGCLGLIFAPLFLLFGLLGTFAGQDKSPFAGIFGIVFAIFMPILYGLTGFITGAVGSLLYNVFARFVGGFELQLELRPTASLAPYPIVPPPTPSI